MTLAKTLGIIETLEEKSLSLSECLIALQKRDSVVGFWNFPDSDMKSIGRVGNSVSFARAYEMDGGISGIISIHQSFYSVDDKNMQFNNIGNNKDNKLLLKNWGKAIHPFNVNFIGALIFRSLVPISALINEDCEIQIDLIKNLDPVNIGCENLFAIVDSVHEACEMLGINKNRILILFTTSLWFTENGINMFKEIKEFYEKYRDTRKIIWQLNLELSQQLIKEQHRGKIPWENSLGLIGQITDYMQVKDHGNELSVINLLIKDYNILEYKGAKSFISFIKTLSENSQVQIKITPDRNDSNEDIWIKYKVRIDEIEKLIPEKVKYRGSFIIDFKNGDGLYSLKDHVTVIDRGVKIGNQFNYDLEMKKKIIILFTGNPSTGKTTSTQRLYFQLMNNYKVALLSTLSIRESNKLLGNLNSNKIREDVYNRIIDQTEEKLKENNEFIILDGNFNKRSRREAVYHLANGYNAYIFVIECYVDREDIIKRRINYRKRHKDNIQHKASSMSLYNLIKDSSDSINGDLLPDGKKPIILKYNTEKQNIKFHFTHSLNRHELTVIEQIYKGLIPERPNKELITNDRKGGNIKAIIFDIGGVIQALRWEYVTRRIARIKPDLTMDQFRNAFYYEKEQFFGLYEISKITAIEFWTMVAQRIGTKIDQIGILSDALTHLYAKVDEEIKAIIMDLKKRNNLFILSNSCLELERAVMEYKDVYRFFDKIYFSHHIGYKKPNAKSYQYVLNDIGFCAEECIFIDDVAVNVKAAEELGMKGILFVSPQDLSKNLEKYLVE